MHVQDVRLRSTVIGEVVRPSKWSKRALLFHLLRMRCTVAFQSYPCVNTSTTISAGLMPFRGGRSAGENPASGIWMVAGGAHDLAAPAALPPSGVIPAAAHASSYSPKHGLEASVGFRAPLTRDDAGAHICARLQALVVVAWSTAHR